MTHKIGIAGFGFVGQAVYKSIKSDAQVNIFDPPKGLGTLDSLKLHSSCIFCCLPTPSGDVGQDASAYRNFFEQMSGYSGMLVIKSTILYSSIKKYCGSMNIVMNPEFLNQNSAYDDFKNQRVVVLGGRVDHCMVVESVYREAFDLSNNPEYIYCTHEEAVNIKYVHNVYHAYKVLFWNYVNEVCGDHRKIFDTYSKITGNTHEMSKVCSDGKPGYGGACFPKDVLAWGHDKKHMLTEFMEEYNNQLRKDDK